MLTQAQHDKRHMLHALALAARGLGRVWPNPAVGALIVKEGRIVGRGWTGNGGRPHAETVALVQAGGDAQGATLYVSLEPCCHQGKTPPCTDAIIRAEIERVVVACEDINPLVAQKGIAALRAAGMEVVIGLLEKDAQELNAGFFSLMRSGRPLVNLKIASSLDDKITNNASEDRWITGQQARHHVHALRRRHDVIITGIGTVEADNPLLTCRLPGLEKDSPIRVVLDSSLAISPAARLVQTARQVPSWVITTEGALEKQSQRAGELTQLGVKVFAVAQKEGKVSIPAALKLLGEQGITRVLVEAGQALNTAFVTGGFVHALYWFRSPMQIGADGLDVFAGPSQQKWLDRPAQRFEVGKDTLSIYNLSQAT